MATAEAPAARVDPEAPDRPLVLAVGIRTATERKLLEGWIAREHPGAVRLDHDDPELVGHLSGDADPLVHPVRVTWLPPPESDDGRRYGDVLQLLRPRRPPGPLQAIVAKTGAERVQVTPGEPARVSDLRARFAREAGAGGPSAFAEYVGRQAVVTVDRAERAIRGDRYKVPHLVAEQIGAGKRFRERIGELAEQLDRPVEEVQADGESCLGELATVQSELGNDVYRAFVAPMHRSAWTVEVDAASVEPLRELNKKSALVFLPTHRSYVDTLVLHEALQGFDMPTNHILGGDNMSWWPLGPLGRRAGVVWIRRAFGSDRVYKLAVREFLGHLVAKRFNLEWYIEGGRTRTGKLRPPKIGLLRYLTEALEDDRSEDVLLVPVAIVYDRLREVTQMTAEQTGAVKQSEGLKWFVEYVRAQSQNVGKARVHIGEPFSLRGALDAAAQDANRLEKVAFRICDEINRVTPITPTALVSFALLGSRDRALSLGQVQQLTDPLLEHLEARGLPGPKEELRRPTGLKRGLEQLVEAGVLSCYDKGTEPVWSIAEGGHHIAAFYRNGAVHHFVNRAIVELTLLQVLRRRGTDDAVAPEHAIEAAWDVALALRDLLKFEFFFAEKEVFRQQLEDELQRIDPAWEEKVVAGDADALLARMRPLVAHRTLRSFVDAQLVVAEQLAARDPRKAIERKAFLAECTDVGGQMVLQGQLHGAESVGRESFAAALSLAANRDLVDPGREDVRAARERWLAEVRDVLIDLEAVEQADVAATEEVLAGA